MSEIGNVLVVGAGVIGSACACALAERGVAVTAIDRRAPGRGCSYGNAGWLTPSLATPLPMPGVLRKSLKWLTKPDSPFYIKPSLNPQLLRWLWRFVRSANRCTAEKSLAALTQMAMFSLDAYRQLDEMAPGAFGFCQRGLILAAGSQAAFDSAGEELEQVRRHGIEGHLLNATELREMEPSLVRGKLAGGVFFPNEAHVEPLATVQFLVSRAIEHGARFLDETELYEFVLHRGRITGVVTTRGLLRADHYVVATGNWSAALTRQIGLRVPVLGGKGYALIVETFTPEPRHPINLADHKLAVTPRAGSVRLAGTLELVDADESITARRVRAIYRGASEYLNLPVEPELVETWRGLRPCTPDGVPIIGQAPQIENLYLATGHQMLGLLSAPATGQLLADLLTGQVPQFDPVPFRADRF